MISLAKAERARELLAERRLSHRQIAEIVGCSRNTVGAIAVGRWRGPKGPKQTAALVETGPKMRCPTCGGKVFMPCRLCHARAVLKEAGTQCRSDSEKFEPLGLELEPDDERRYREAVRMREARELDQTADQWEEPVAGG